MSKQDELKKLKNEVDKDQSLPLRKGATQLVFGEGNPDAKIYFLGEAPGYWEDQKGRPFVGQAGKLLDKLIQELGMSRDGVYISNVVRFRPPENRDPLPAELEAFAPYVDREIEIINPKVIVTLGRYSMAKFFPDVKISQVHGKPRRLRWRGRDITVVPMYHPAAALRSTDVLNALREDFKIIKSVLSEDMSAAASAKGFGEPREEKKNELEQMSLI